MRGPETLLLVLSGLLLDAPLVSRVDFGHQHQIGPQPEVFRRHIGHRPPQFSTPHASLLHALIDGAPQRFLVRRLGFDAAQFRPINGVGVGQAPIQRPVLLIYFLDELGVHFVNVAHFARPFALVRRLRMEEGLDIRMPPQDILHVLRQPQFVVHVGVVQVESHLVLVEPGKVAIEECFGWIDGDGVVAQQLDATLDPMPAVLRVLELDGDVVSHVPGLDAPDIDEMRFQLGDPIGQLHHVEVFVLVLHLVGANPQGVGDKAPEAAQRHGGEGQGGRGVIQRGEPGQTQFRAVQIDPILHLRRNAKEKGGQPDQGRFINSCQCVHLPALMFA